MWKITSASTTEKLVITCVIHHNIYDKKACIGKQGSNDKKITDNCIDPPMEMCRKLLMVEYGNCDNHCKDAKWRGLISSKEYLKAYEYLEQCAKDCHSTYKKLELFDQTRRLRKTRRERSKIFILKSLKNMNSIDITEFVVNVVETEITGVNLKITDVNGRLMLLESEVKKIKDSIYPEITENTAMDPEVEAWYG